MESLFKSDYNIRNISNLKTERVAIENVKEFIENFIHHSGYGVGSSEVASMLRELADKWDD